MSETRVRVWDLPTRLFHWAVVAVVAFQFTTAELGLLDWHIAGGCTMLALLLFRLIWGFVGSDTARFARFIRGPGAALRHLATFTGQPEETTLGHTASGGWAILAMLFLLLMQVGTGLFADDDISTQGPLGQYVSRATRKQLTGLHVRLFWVLLALIAVHITAIAAYRFIKRKDLVTPMLTGWAPALAGVAPPRMSRLWLALAVFAACGFAAWKIWSLSDTI